MVGKEEVVVGVPGVGRAGGVVRQEDERPPLLANGAVGEGGGPLGGERGVAGGVAAIDHVPAARRVEEGHGVVVREADS